MTSVLLLTTWATLAAPSTSAISDPTDVRGVLRGGQAVSLDPAASSVVAGPELSLRSRFIEPGDDQQWGVYGVAPLGPLSLSLGYEWLRQAFEYRRATVGLGLDLGHDVAIGIAYRNLHQVRGDTATVWDASLLAEPASWLSLAVGVDQMNEPRFAGSFLDRSWWVGAGVRPLLGAPWLTLGGEANLSFASDRKVLTSPRLLVDVSPLAGLHARAAWSPDDHQLWFGLALSIVGLEVGATGGGDRRSFGDTAQGGVALTLRSRPAESLVTPRGRTVEIPLQGELQQSSGLLSSVDPISPVATALVGLAGDPTVSRVVLNIGDLDVSSAEIDELRAAIKILRSQGKTVVAELAGGAEKEYLVAAACDRIRLDPSTSLVLDGYSVTLVYLADTLSRVGVRVDAVSVGRYKTAPDQLTRTASRPEEREVQNGILGQLYASFVDALVKDRHLKPAAVEEVIARALVTPAEALKLGLVDELSQPTDPKQLPVVRDTGEALDAAGKPSRRWSTPPVIAVVPLVGNITANGAAGVLPGGAAEAGRVVRALDELRHDGDVKAVVLRIDSPGGEVYASEVIWRAARLLAADKPLVVSMGAVAASGGYYVAAPAHVILAEPSTITGSIGIFMLKPDLSGLLKLTGARAEVLELGPHAGWSSPLRGLTEQEKAIAHDGLAVEYETFLQRVGEGRRLPLDKVRALAEGRVYTGQQALAVGLVDGIGGLAEAIAEAQLRAGLAPDTEVEVRVQREPVSLGTLVGSLSRAGASPVDAVVESLAKLQSLASLPLARLPFEVMIQ